MRTLLAVLAVLLIAASALAQPANDACSAATAITSLPFTAAVDTSTATTDPGDPGGACNYADTATVWFTYTAGHDVTLHVDTFGSDYDNTITVHTGGCASPAEIACAYDDDFDGNTELVVPVAAGTTVHILVAGDFNGGNLVLHVAPAAFDATPPVSLVAAVKSGDPTPIGGGFAYVARPVLLSKTDVAFTGTTKAVIAHDGATSTMVAVSGAPTPLGGTWGDIGQPAGGAGGTVAFVASLNGASVRSGLFAYSGGVVTPLAVEGDPAPGGGTFRRFVRGIAISPNGMFVAFIADTVLAPGRDSVWVAGVGGGVIGPLLTELVDPSPCGGTMRAFGNSIPVLAINDAGEIALFARSISPTVDEVLLFSAGWFAVACEGQPTPLGGTYRAIARNVRIGNGPAPGQVTFVSTVTLPGPDTEAVFRASAGGVFVVAADGDLTTGGESIFGFASTATPDVDPAGDVFFHAQTSAGNAILRRAAGAPAATILARPGDPCPAGGTFLAFDTWLDTDASGALVFRAACTGGAGIFRLPSGGSPVTLALGTDATPVGPGFAFDNPTAEGTSAAFIGSRTGVYRIHCASGACGTVTIVAQPLTPAPGLPGESISTIDETVLAGQGDLVAFVASTDGTVRRTALLAARSGVLELVTGTGLTIPGTAIEVDDVVTADTSSALPTPVGVGKRGVAFVATIFDPNDINASSALYLARGGVVTEIARDGQLAPNGESYRRFGAPLVKGSRVYFRTETDFGRTCFVRGTSAAHQGLGCAGDAVTTPVGSTLSTVEPDVPALGSRGPVFRGQVYDFGINECLFTATTRGPSPLACSGDLLPYGGAVSDFPTTVLGASKRRVASFVDDRDFIATGLYEFSNRARARIAVNGLPTPLGGVYALSDPRPSVFVKTVAFVSDVTGGSSGQALFLAVLRR